MDNTEKVINNYRGLEKIIYLKQSNGGPSSARNTGILQAKGKYVCFLDADDYYTPQSLELRVEALKIYNVDVVIGRSKVINNELLNDDNFFIRYCDSIITHSGKIYLCDAEKFQKLIIMYGPYVLTNSITFKKDLLIKLNMFDVSFRLNEDWDLWYRTFFSISKFGFINDILSVYNYQLTNHERHDIVNYFSYERRRVVNLIKLLNQRKYDCQLVSILKRKICSRKYKCQGISNYRRGYNFRALKFYFKGMRIYKNDKEFISLILKCLVPKILRYKILFLRNKLINEKRSINLNTN
jgi:glycosyltransferase involved in cell wall biosynthesis